jgi:hypothetical protein
LTGGRLDDCCASAPENDATAISPATAETLVPEAPSIFPSAKLTAAIARNDRGAMTCPILFRPPQIFASHRLCGSFARQCDPGIERADADQFEELKTRIESLQIKTVLRQT